MVNKLKQSTVEFLPEEHEYWSDDVKLNGITGFLSKYLFPDKYSDVPPAVLKKACERGSLIHAQISDSVNGFRHSEELQETLNFYFLAESKGLKFISTEYLVSDNSFIASPIDLVGDNFDLYDIKTTAVLDSEYLSWQLSIYAYLFELQNGFPCGNLYAIWLKGSKKKLVEVAKIDEDIVKDFLFHCQFGDGEFKNPLAELAESTKSLLADITDAYRTIRDLKADIAEVEAEISSKTSKVQDLIKKEKKTKIETDEIRITYVAPVEKKTFDSKKLKAENEDLFMQYIKHSTSKESIRVKLKE